MSPGYASRAPGATGSFIGVGRRHLIGGGPDIAWNFGKFLVDSEGRVRARFEPTVKPGAPEVLAALDELRGG